MSRFTLPRDLYFGKGSLEELKNLKGKKAILVLGGGSMKKFGFIGAGKMAGAIIHGMLAGGSVKPAEIMCSCGNDDTGTMSAWLAFSMMGLYPTVPGVPDYIIGSPLFDTVTIALDKEFYGRDSLTIRTHRESPEDIYIDRITVGGKPFKGFFIDSKKLTEAGVIDIYMSSKHK